jgi:hypothetical protein
MIARILLSAIIALINLFSQIGAFIIRAISFVGKLWEYPVIAFFYVMRAAVVFLGTVRNSARRFTQTLVLFIRRELVKIKALALFAASWLVKSAKTTIVLIRTNFRLMKFAGLGLITSAVIIAAMIYIPFSDISYFLMGSRSGPIQIYDRNGVILYADQDRIVDNNEGTYKRAPHAVDYVFSELDERSKKRLFKYGGIVKTTLDVSLQNSIQQELLASALKHNNYNTFDVAVIVIDKQSGEIASMIGSLNYFSDPKGRKNGVTVPIQLGGLQLSLSQIAQEYAAIANKKEQKSSYLVQSITDHSGRTVYENSQKVQVRASKEVTEAILKALARQNSSVSVAIIDGKDGKQKIVATKSNLADKQEFMGRILENISSSKQAHSSDVIDGNPDDFNINVEMKGGEQ